MIIRKGENFPVAAGYLDLRYPALWQGHVAVVREDASGSCAASILPAVGHLSADPQSRLWVVLMDTSPISAGDQISVNGRQLAIPDLETSENALILFEVYWRNGTPKVRSVFQGFRSGAGALFAHLGCAVPSAPISLYRARPARSDASQTWRVAKSDRRDAIHANLNWSQVPSPFGSRSVLGLAAIDFDLACLVEDRYGHKTCVQAIGGTKGDLDYYPFVRLRGDDRTGAVSDGEWIDINGKMWTEFSRILIFAFVYEGAVDWSGPKPVLTIHAGSDPVILPLDGHDHQDRLMAIAMLQNDAGHVSIRKEGRFFPGQAAMDTFYDWGLTWAPGGK